MKKGFLTAGTILTILGLLILIFYGPGSTNISNIVADIYLRDLIGLAPGLAIVVVGAWLISRGLSGVVVPNDLKDMLGANEKVQLYVKQTNYRPRPMGVDSWLLTNERVIKRHPHGLKLRNSYEDHSYAEIKALKFDQGVFRSKLVCDLKVGAKQIVGNVTGSSEVAEDKSRATQDKQVSELETERGVEFALDLLAKLDARKADGIIRENIVRFQTPFFQTAFPPDKIAYDSSQKTV